jgi:hypothetical protein
MARHIRQGLPFVANMLDLLEFDHWIESRFISQDSDDGMALDCPYRRLSSGSLARRPSPVSFCRRVISPAILEQKYLRKTDTTIRFQPR